MLSIFAKAEPYLFLAPALAILLVFLIFPLFWNIYISLHNVSFITVLRGWEYVGGLSLLISFNDPNFHTSLKVSLLFVGGSVALQFGMGMLMSVLLNQKVRGCWCITCNIHNTVDNFRSYTPLFHSSSFSIIILVY